MDLGCLWMHSGGRAHSPQPAAPCRVCRLLYAEKAYEHTCMHQSLRTRTRTCTHTQVGIATSEIADGVDSVRTGNFPLPETNHTVVLGWHERQTVALLKEVRLEGCACPIF